MPATDFLPWWPVVTALAGAIAWVGGLQVKLFNLNSRLGQAEGKIEQIEKDHGSERAEVRERLVRIETLLTGLMDKR